MSALLAQAPAPIEVPAIDYGALLPLLIILAAACIAVLTPLVVLILVLGFFPGPVLDVINPSVVSTMNEVGLPDPVGGLVK